MLMFLHFNIERTEVYIEAVRIICHHRIVNVILAGSRYTAHILFSQRFYNLVFYLTALDTHLNHRFTSATKSCDIPDPYYEMII